MKYFNPKNCRSLKTFTLVELLVVIGIIAMLVAILLPALSKAKETAKMVACLSNQKQVGLLLSCYQLDYRYRSPGAVSGWNGNWTYYWNRYIDGLPADEAGAVDDRYYSGGDPYAKNSLFRCTKNRWVSDTPSNVYGMYENPRYNSEDKKFMVEEIDNSIGKGYRYFKMQAMPFPSKFLMLGCSLKLLDQSKSYWGEGSPKFNREMVDSSPPVNTLSGLWMSHFNRVNGLFADQHAANIGPDDLFATKNGYITDSDTGVRAWKLADGTDVDLYP